MLPVIILGGLRAGLFTPTEAAVVAAVYSLFVSLFVYREVKFAELVKLLVDAAAHHQHRDVPVRRRAGVVATW